MFRFKPALIFVAIVTLLWGGFEYWQSIRDIQELASSIVPGSAVSNVGFQPSFPSSFVQLEGTGILAVSTGEISEFEFLNANSGETIGKASVLDAVTKNAEGKIKRMSFVLQLSLTTNPQRNLIPWITAKASQLRARPNSESGKIMTNDQLAQIFSKGSKWIFIPVLDLDSGEIWESLPEYQFYARSYYGEKLTEFRDFVESGLSGSWQRPVPLLDIFYLFP